MTDTNAENWSNYWEGRTGVTAGEALVGVGVENDGEIAAFWDEALGNLNKDGSLLDLACGAGSVIRCAKAAGFTNLTGADISQAAITALTNEFPKVTGVTAPANATGLPDGEFDIIVSQFGFEYAGAEKTAPEIARIMAPGATFIALAHKTGSEIEREVAGFRDQAKSILDTNFVAVAKQLFRADRTPNDEAGFNTAAANFRPAQDALLSLAKEAGGLAAHLYSGTQTMFQNPHDYKLEAALGWLDGMEREVTAYYGRMQSMMDVALSRDDIVALQTALAESGLTCGAPEIFYTGFAQEEMAWIIRASKTA